jgi:Family of unknown function (DUF6088)
LASQLQGRSERSMNNVRPNNGERRAPSVPAVLEALTAATGETIAAHGAAAANSLGLTTQVPVRTVYLASGPSRRLNFGAQTVELQHAPLWQLSLAGRPAGDAIRALAWLGRGQGRAMTSKLGKALSAQTIKELSAARGRLPTWMATDQHAGRAGLTLGGRLRAGLKGAGQESCVPE